MKSKQKDYTQQNSRSRRSTANYTLEIYARNGEGIRHVKKKPGSTHTNSDCIEQRMADIADIGQVGTHATVTDEDEDDDDGADSDGDGDGDDVDGDGDGDGDGGDDGDDGDEDGDDEEKQDRTGGKKPELANIDDRQKSAVLLHLLSHPECLQVYDDSLFTVLCCARSLRQLKVLEAVYIRSLNPVLCRQKKFVIDLKLFT